MEKSRKPCVRAPAIAETYSPTLRCIDSRDLFAGSNHVLIEHAGATYRLQITSQGKLLLTK
jgi:hemin uptake protein HemP